MKKIGISLIGLIITVVVLIILAAVIILAINKNDLFSSSKEAKFKNDVMAFNDELNVYVMTKYIGHLGEYSRTSLNAQNIQNIQGDIQPIQNIIPSMTDKVYLSKIKVTDGKLAFSNLTEEEQKWVNELQPLLNASSTDGGISEGDTTNSYIQAGVNPPIVPSSNNQYSTKVGQGINAITFDANGKVQIVTDLSQEWFQYIAQTSDTAGGGTSKWANIQTKDGSQWVWIPRFAYKITKGAHTKVGYKDFNGLTEGEAGTIEIKFLKGNTNQFYDGNGTAQIDPNNITYNENGVQSNFLVHPGFCFDGKQLTGFWAAKYEASSAQGNGDSLDADNVLNIKTLQIKPNVSSWRNMEAKNMFGNCIFLGTEHFDVYGLKQNTNTHLLKNDEWGAIAYLAHSTYGRNGTEITANQNEDYITGSGGKLASTTGNYYGVFDMSGGAHDAVAAKFDLNQSDFDIFGKDTDVSEYIDIYPKYANTYKGDALFETSLRFSTTTSWFSDLSWSVNASEPFMSRGGCISDGTSAGIFAFYRYKPEWYQLARVSYRPTITLEQIANTGIVGSHT